jgi:hypothetical protein
LNHLDFWVKGLAQWLRRLLRREACDGAAEGEGAFVAAAEALEALRQAPDDISC